MILNYEEFRQQNTAFHFRKKIILRKSLEPFIIREKTLETIFTQRSGVLK